MKVWIKEKLATLRQTYLCEVLRMTGDYNREVERTKEYHGRQLLELLQNADDEAENTKDPSVLIRLAKNRLVIANNGQPFSNQGVLSLMYSDNSPKIKRQKKIGYKGLGFRAILNWSDSIWIKSGLFSLEFSRENAISFLKQLLEEKPSLREEIYTVHNQKYPIATLAVPAWKDSDELDTSEYNTYVVINFSSEKVREDMQNQINELGMEVLIFLNNLKKIKLESPERNEAIVKTPLKKKDHEKVKLLDQDGQVVKSKKWRIFSRNGELPKHLRQDEMVLQYEYDLRIAVSEGLDDDINSLFCFFRTEVKFPFPAIIHGTFDLDGNRNHLNKNDVNEFLLAQLAHLMIDTAKKLSQTRRKVNWDAMKLLAKKGDFDDKVEKMGFYEKLVEAMKSHKLIPVLSNKYMSVEEKPVFYKAPFADILKIAPKTFHDLALYTNDADVLSLLDKLGIGKYETDYFIKNLNKISESLSPRLRSNLIVLTVDNYSSYFSDLKPAEMPSLFLGDKGKVVRSKVQALLPPERSRFQLPEGMTITFVSNDLFSLLKRKTNSKTSRALAYRLDCFNIQEYRFDAVIRKIVTITNNRIRKNASKASEYIQKMLRSLYLIHSEDSESERKFSEVNVRLLTRAGKIRTARELYFGREYSAGKIMDALYAGIDDTVFVAAKEDFGFEDEDENKVGEFLKWIGVEEYPRIEKKELKGVEFDSAYEDYVLQNLTYPYETNHNETYLSYEQLKSDKGYWRSNVKVDDIAELDDILDKANFEAILVWLRCDSRMQNIIKDGHESLGSSIGVWFHKKQQTRNLRPSEISSYILWKLRTTEWVKTRSGKKVKPDVCCLSKTLIDMSPMIEVPAYNIKDEVFKEHKIQSEDVEHLLVKGGVSRDFTALPTETIYAILTQLETVDPEGKRAREIYRQIIERPREWARTVVKHKARKDFVEKGKLLAKTDGKLDYFPVKDVYYVDNITFCKEIMHQFPIAQIKRRSGKEQVREIFGVKPLEDIRFSMASNPKLHPLNTDFSKTFEGFKPYMLVYRLDKPTLTTELNHLKKLKIVLCSDISATYQFDDTEGGLQLNPYEHIQVEYTAYLLLNPGKDYRNISDLKEDIRFCESLAEIITGILKVGENLKDYRELFPKDKQQRDLIIQSDIDDPDLEKLKQARELFHSLSDLQKEFWECVLQLNGSDVDLAEIAAEEDLTASLAKELGLKEDFLMEIYEGIFYEDYSSSSNLPYFQKLFKALQISVEDFNNISVDQIDFAEHFESEITSEKYRLLARYKSFIFEYLKDKDIEEKAKFVGLVRTYENAPILREYDIHKELVIDREKYFYMLFQKDTFKEFKLTYSALLRQEKTELENRYSRNKTAFRKKLEETGGAYAEDVDSFLDQVENKSLLCFGEYDELVTRFDNNYTRPTEGDGGGAGGTIKKKKKTITLNGKEEDYEEDIYESLLKNVDDDCENTDYDIESHDPTKPTETPGQRRRRASGSGRGGGRRKQTKEIGLLGEYYVYKALVKKYSAEKVFWVSEYAKIAGVNPDGKDGEGYDIRYLDENNQVRYVEVKASTDDDYAFPISKAEVQFGEEHKSDYEAIVVPNVLNRGRELINLGNIFDYEEDESFNNNSKFLVENDSFKIRFE